jgi:hypothetical protein
MENDLLFCSKLMFTNGNIVDGKYRDASQKSITGDACCFLTIVKQMANITSNMFSFIFLTEQLIINGKKQK